MFKKFILFFALVICFVTWGSLFAQEEPGKLYGINGTILEIDPGAKSFVIKVKDSGEQKVILTTSRTSFNKEMKIVDFNAFQAGDSLTISTTDNPSGSEITAVGIFDSETAFLLKTGQGLSVEYEGNIYEKKDNMLTLLSEKGKKKFAVTAKTTIVKDMKTVSLDDLKQGDNVHIKASFPGYIEHEPEILDADFIGDDLSYLNNMLQGSHGPLVLRGKVTDVIEKKSIIQIGDEKILANSKTVMLVPMGFTGFSDLKGKDVMVYSITQPMPGRTYIAGAIFLEEALPLILDNLKKAAMYGGESVSVASGKITRIDKVKNTVMVETDKGSSLLLGAEFSRVIDDSEPGRHGLTLSYLREGDIIEAEGYDINRVKTITITQKATPGVSRSKLNIDICFFADLSGYVEPFETAGSNVYTFVPEEGTMEDVFLTAEAGGLSYLSGAYKEITKKSQNKLLICNGNFLYGTPLAQATGGKGVIDCCNLLGVNVAVLGEQDFFVGKEKLVELIGQAEFPVVCSNVLSQGTGELLPGLKPYVILPYGDLKIGVMGLVREDIATVLPSEYQEGLSFNPYKTALFNYYSKLETEADIIIILANQEAYDNLLMANSFETILPGATKKPLFIIGSSGSGFSGPSTLPENANDILLIEPGPKGKYLGHFNLAIVDNITDFNYLYEILSISPSVVKTPDSDMETLINSLKTGIPGEYSEVIGTAETNLLRLKEKESGLGDFVTDALLKATGADIALYSGRELRFDIFKGDITNGLLYEAIPYPSKTVVIEMTGADIKETMEQALYKDFMLQVAGIKVVYDKSRPWGKRVVELTVGGSPVVEEQTYKVVTSGFLTQGSDGYRKIMNGTVISEGELVRKVVADYIKELKTLKVDTEAPERIVIE